jgi:periplasmic protein CpxP/Spy
MFECMETVCIPTENFMKVIAAVLVSTFVFGGAVAQTPEESASPHASADSSASAMANSDAKRDGAVEKHIKELHATLKITSAEESQWNEVAKTMRENAKDLDRAIDKRDVNVASATAIDDLNAYVDIAQAHANGVKKLASVFSALYSAMSNDQKKEADEVFSHHGHEARKIASR